MAGRSGRFQPQKADQLQWAMVGQYSLVTRWEDDRFRCPPGRTFRHFHHAGEWRVANPLAAGRLRRKKADLVARWPIHLLQLESRRQPADLEAIAADGRDEDHWPAGYQRINRIRRWQFSGFHEQCV